MKILSKKGEIYLDNWVENLSQVRNAKRIQKSRKDFTCAASCKIPAGSSYLLLDIICSPDGSHLEFAFCETHASKILDGRSIDDWADSMDGISLLKEIQSLKT